MPIYLRRGFNRSFLVLTIAWAIYCAVLYPLQMQFEGQRRAVSQHDEDTKMCRQLMVGRPDWDLTKNCFARIDQDQKSAMELHSFKNFWIWDVVFWRLEIPAIVLPPLLIYALAMLVRWIRRGFEPPANGSVSV